MAERYFMDYLNRKKIMKNKKRRPVCLTVGEAIKILETMKSKSQFLKEIKKHPHKKDWIVEGDNLDKDGNIQLYIVENNKENNRALFQHKPINLNNL